MTARLRLAAALVVWAAVQTTLGGAMAASAPPAGFVTATPGGFQLDGAPFRVVGANQYSLVSSTSFGGTDKGSARALKLNALRVWAFSDGDRPGALQPSAGVYSEASLRAMDAAVASAGAAGLRLTLVLVNYWPDYGGAPQYVQWARDNGEAVGSSVDAFYTSPTARHLYRRYVSMLLTRTNTITGIEYRNDSTVLAWQLMNEARSEDSTGDTLWGWFSEMAAFVKALDPHHMLSLGVEGFFGPSTPVLEATNPFAQRGSDFVRHHSLPTVDFCTLHSYPDQWLQCGASDEACVVGFARSWFASHLEACASLRKPLLLEEFGLRVPAWPISARDALFEAAFGQALASVRAGGPAAGAMFWLLAPTATTPDYDGYTVYTGTSTAQLVMQAADNMAALG